MNRCTPSPRHLHPRCFHIATVFLYSDSSVHDSPRKSFLLAINYCSITQELQKRLTGLVELRTEPSTIVCDSDEDLDEKSCEPDPKRPHTEQGEPSPKNVITYRRYCNGTPLLKLLYLAWRFLLTQVFLGHRQSSRHNYVSNCIIVHSYSQATKYICCPWSYQRWKNCLIWPTCAAITTMWWSGLLCAY